MQQIGQEEFTQRLEQARRAVLAFIRYTDPDYDDIVVPCNVEERRLQQDRMIRDDRRRNEVFGTLEARISVCKTPEEVLATIKNELPWNLQTNSFKPEGGIDWNEVDAATLREESLRTKEYYGWVVEGLRAIYSVFWE